MVMLRAPESYVFACSFDPFAGTKGKNGGPTVCNLALKVIAETVIA